MKREAEIHIYELENPEICFKPCDVFNSDSPAGCTKYNVTQKNWQNKYTCACGGIHFFCPKHQKMEMYEKSLDEDFGPVVLWCDKCATKDKEYSGIELKNKSEVIERAKFAVQAEKLKNAKLVRIDDQCYELKMEKLKTNDQRFFCTGKVETDINDNVQINLYVGCIGDKKKAHFFIEPEVSRLRYEISDRHIDPAKIISKITIEMKDRKIVQEYKEEKNND